MSDNTSDFVSDSQARILHVLADFPGWHVLTRLQESRMLQPGDMRAIPSLIERRLIEHQTRRGMVAITPAGRDIARRSEAALARPVASD